MMKDIEQHEVGQRLSMTTMEIAKQTGKRHDHVLRDTRKMLTELYGSDALPKFGERYDAADGNVYDCFALPKNEILILISGYSIPLRAAIVRRLDELEKELMKNKLVMPNFSNPAEAARAWALEYEQKQIALAERDEAIKTKAWISDKKTATAMATASVKARENEKLKEQLGDSKNYKQVKAIPWLTDYFNLKIKAAYSQIGRYLSRISDECGYEPKEIPDSTWGKVKAYHIDVINRFKNMVAENPSELEKYRKV